jgi:hypothetical protein
MTTSKRESQHKRLAVGDRVRAKTTGRVGDLTDIQQQDSGDEQLTVTYDRQPQDAYLTTPAREGTSLPPELVDRAT